MSDKPSEIQSKTINRYHAGLAQEISHKSTESAENHKDKNLDVASA
jgi:hypothetical protein